MGNDNCNFENGISAPSLVCFLKWVAKFKMQRNRPPKGSILFHLRRKDMRCSLMKCLWWKQSDPRKNLKSVLCLWQRYSLIQCPLSRGPTGIVSTHSCWCIFRRLSPKARSSVWSPWGSCLPTCLCPIPKGPDLDGRLIWQMSLWWYVRRGRLFLAPLTLPRTACSLRSLPGIITEGSAWNQITALWERGFWTRFTHGGKWKFHSFFLKNK